MDAGEVIGRNGDQRYIPVQSAIEGEVRLLGVYIVVFGIVHRHAQQIFRFQCLRQVCPEGGKAPLVVVQLPAVQIDIGDVGSAVDLQNGSAALLQLRLGKCLAVQGGAPPVVVAAVLAVDGVPGVGKLHPVPVFRQSAGDFLCFGKPPIAVKMDTVAHRPVLSRKSGTVVIDSACRSGHPAAGRSSRRR